MKLTDRSTGDLLVLMIAATICVSVVLTGTGVGIYKILHPDANVVSVGSSLSEIITTLVGLMAGFLAGRTEYKRNGSSKSDNE